MLVNMALILLIEEQYKQQHAKALSISDITAEAAIKDTKLISILSLATPIVTPINLQAYTTGFFTKIKGVSDTNSQDTNLSTDIDSKTMGILLCSRPHISEHCP